MSESDNKRLLRAYVEAFNAFDTARLRELFAADARIYGVLGFGSIDLAEPIWRELHEGLQIRLEPLAIIEEGPQIAVRYRKTGKFVGPYRGLPGVAPTGKSYELVAMEWFDIQDGKIVSRWGARDSAALNRQIS
jgi:predicted ester cyclase